MTGLTGTGISTTYASGLAYHSNGMLNTVTHGNGVTDTQSNDPHGMPRPSKISAAAGSTILWSSGVNTPYAYDGGGNVEAVGLEPGVLAPARDGAVFVLTNAGGVTTFVMRNGEIIVKKGTEIVLHLLAE